MGASHVTTLGIDLSSQRENTTGCVIQWGAAEAVISSFPTRLTDRDILDLKRDLGLNLENDAIGIDAPFGWPEPFIRFVDRTPTGTPGPLWSTEWARVLTLRATDLRVKTELQTKPGPALDPLRVTADKIAYTALRCSGILDALGVTDRSGGSGVFEVYPAASLKAWGLPFRKYKGNDPVARALRSEMLSTVSEQCHWLTWAHEADRKLIAENDHALDALIAALTTRAAMLGQTVKPNNPDEIARARTEGWIAFPASDCQIASLIS